MAHSILWSKLIWLPVYHDKLFRLLRSFSMQTAHRLCVGWAMRWPPLFNFTLGNGPIREQSRSRPESFIASLERFKKFFRVFSKGWTSKKARRRRRFLDFSPIIQPSPDLVCKRQNTRKARIFRKSAHIIPLRISGCSAACDLWMRRASLFFPFSMI